MIEKLPWPQPELPTYRKGRFGNWESVQLPAIEQPSAGYFLPHLKQNPGWCFKRSGTIWMSLSKMEIESQMPHIAAATGHTVIAGLGMGFVLYNIMRKPEVTKVTVLENDPEVVALLDQVSEWREWEGHEKLELVMIDATEWTPSAPVDFLYADIWPLVGDGEALPLTKKIQANVQAKLVGYWCQEFDLVDFARGFNLAIENIDRRVWRYFMLEQKLPLIERDSLVYPRLATIAVTLQAAAALRDRNEKRLMQHIAADLMQSYDPIKVAMDVNRSARQVGKRLLVT